jgi:multidrug efflux pump subunit AcrA (membrane-fusion protein)
VGAIALPGCTEMAGRLSSSSETAEQQQDSEDNAHEGEDDAGHDHSDQPHTADDHSGHDHSGGSDAEDSSLELTPQARGNLGLETETVSVSSFTEYVSMPGTIIDWPGRTHVSVTAPLTGVVNAIYVSRGELIQSGQPLFSMRLTHQDLVQTQAEFLTALGRMDVEDREIQRLNSAAQSGAIAMKTLIQRQYERDRLLAEIQAERQAMLLHGLSEAQIAAIEQTRKLVREVTIFAPALHADDSLHHDSESKHDHSHDHPDEQSDPPLAPASVQQAAFATQPASPPIGLQEVEFLVTEVSVNRGQSVNAGQPLGRLSDYTQVLIEGHAFQKDAKALRSAANLRLRLQAVIDWTRGRPEIIDGLSISYIGSEVDLESRALPFYVPLENKIERSEQREDERYVSWRFKPGQRLQLRVPIQAYDNTIVVPKDAVAEDGVERYVFVDHGDHFDRRPVRVLVRDAFWIAIANDGSVREGQEIAISGAHQLLMAMKKKAGGPVDPHAGHNH